MALRIAEYHQTRLPLGLVVCESEPACGAFTTRFVGQEPEARARDYYNAIRRRAVNNRIT